VIKKNKSYRGFAAKRTLTCTKLATNKKPGKQVIVERGAYACPAGYKR
jgi:hypothetical protein